MIDSDWRKLILPNPINEKILHVIENELNFKQLTKVQNSVIPIFTKNKDVIVKVLICNVFRLVQDQAKLYHILYLYISIYSAS